MIHICIVFSSLLAFTAIATAATTWYVDDSGGADFSSIQAAVDAASTGDTIIVSEGTYLEQITIPISLTLSGQNKDTVIIDCSGSDNCIYITNSNVQINGFTITNANGNGIRADYSDLNIKNVTITDNDERGIFFVHGKKIAIRDSAIDGNGAGVIYYNNANGDAIVEDNIIINNIGSGVHVGLIEGKSAIIRNNKIDNNAGSSSDGIYVGIAGSGGLMTIEKNSIKDSGRYGIYLVGVRIESSIADFSVQGSGSDGVRADYSDLNIKNVTITDNGVRGIYFVHGKSFAIRNSTIDGNGDGGVIYYDNANADAIVEDNTIINNVGSGIHIGLIEGKSAIIKNNEIDNNAGSSSDGIRVGIAGSGGLMTIKNNPVIGSGRYGIYLTGVRTGSSIADFSVQGSGLDGIRADYSDLNIENVTITNNGVRGIYFVHGKSFAIRNSIINGNGGGGVIYYDNANGDAIVEDNTIINNVGSGIHIGLIEGKSAIIKNNEIDNNAGSSSDGIYVGIAGSGGLMTIKNNPVIDSGRYGIYLTGVRTGSSIEDFSVQGSGSDGIRSDYSNLNMENITITDNDARGIYFVHGKSLTIRDCTINDNNGGIIYYDAANDNAIVEDSNIINNVGSGIHIILTEGKNATIKNNEIENNAGSSSDGIYVKIVGSGGVMSIDNNPVVGSGRYGIYLTGAKDSVIVNNNVSSNYHGIRLYSSSNNMIYHNNFINDINGLDNSDSNLWDNDYPSGGNYWSDYLGEDTDNDGIGNTPYNIDGGAGALDRYPIIKMNGWCVDDWRMEWTGPDSEEGATVTTNELQDAIHCWLEDILVRGHLLTTSDLQEIIVLWLSG